jgi:hypothetical protein
LGDGDVRGVALLVARDAFDRLAAHIQTAVSVVVYDVDRAQEFLTEARGRYEETLNLLKRMTPVSAASIEHCDCAELPGFYRPARFGRSQHKQSHSGWECWREKEIHNTLTGGRDDGQ